MFRRLSRLLGSRLGRTLSILAALGLLWAAWWMWPERPLRTVVIDRIMKHREDASVAPNGMFALLSNIQCVNPGEYKSRVIDLRNGKEVISQQQLGSKKYGHLSSQCHWICMRSENQPLVFDIKEGRFLENPWFDEKDNVKFWASAEYAGWKLVDPDVSEYAISKVDLFLSYFDFRAHDVTTEYAIEESTSGSVSRKIRDWSWCGFAHHDRCWTQNHFSEPKIILSEWDISFPRPPFWLWLITGGAGGFLISRWRRSKPAV